VSYLSDLATDNQRVNAPRFFVLSLLLSKNPISPNLICFSKYQVFSSSMFRCLFSAFVSVPSLLFQQSAITQANRQRAV
jgi:hypothetical protein